MWRVIALLVVLMSVLVMPVLAQDTQETKIGVHGVLVDGQNLSGTLQAPEDGMHLYAFEGAAGTTVTVSMSQTGGTLDPVLILLAKDGTLIAWDDDGGEDLNAQISAPLPETDTYFVLASTLNSLYRRGENDDVNGSYGIAIAGASNTSEDIMLDPAQLAIQQAQLDTSLPASIDEQHPVFLAWLTVQDSIIVDLNAVSSEVDTLMYVFDVEGNRIAIDDDGGADGVSAYVQALPLTEPGQYLIMVTSFDYHSANERGLSGGAFNLIVSRSS